jgi:hypothetical protein
MKKTFLSMLLIGSSCALFAQGGQAKKDTVPDTIPTTIVRDTVPVKDTVPKTTVTPTTPTTQTPTNPSTPDDKTTLKSTGQYSAYSAAVSVPPNIQGSFTTNFPGVSDVRWEQNQDWYRASYTTGGRRMRMMYDTRGNSFALALPVTSGLIPDDVIEKAYTLYGDNVYDITRLMLAPPKPDTTMAATTMNPTMPSATTDTTVSAEVTTDTSVAADPNAAVTNPAAVSGNPSMMTITVPPRGVIYQVRIIENGEVRTERMNEDGTPYTEAYWRVPDEQEMNQMDPNMNPTQPAPADSVQQMAPTDTSSMQRQDSTMHDQDSLIDDPDKSDDQKSEPDPNAPQKDSSQKSDATLPSSPKKEQ